MKISTSDYYNWLRSNPVKRRSWQIGRASSLGSFLTIWNLRIDQIQQESPDLALVFPGIVLTAPFEARYAFLKSIDQYLMYWRARLNEHLKTPADRKIFWDQDPKVCSWIDGVFLFKGKPVEYQRLVALIHANRKVL